jgi:threonine/homoserine efflux transporter RhtA
MTTAFAAAANRSFFTSLRAQPFGFVLAVATAVSFWGGLHVAVFGSRLGVLGGRMLRPMWVTWAGMLLIGAWLYKIASMKGW